MEPDLFASYAFAFIALVVVPLAIAASRFLTPDPSCQAKAEDGAEDLVFYTIEPGCPPFYCDYVRWWVVKRTPEQPHSQIKEGDLV